MRKLTQSDIDLKVKKLTQGQVFINWDKSGPYINNKQKVYAVDKNLGEWKISIDKLLSGRNHPGYKKVKINLTENFINNKIKEVYKDKVYIDWEKSGPCQHQLMQKVYAVDKDFGGWWVKLSFLFNGVLHRQRYYQSKKLTKEIVDQKIKEKFKDEVFIDWAKTPADFTTKTKVVAVDKVYGEWRVVLNKLLRGANHPKKSHHKQSLDKKYSQKEIDDLILIKHKGNVFIDWEKTGPYINNEQVLVAVDKDYGPWNIRALNLLRGQGHRERILDKRRLTKEEIDKRINVIFGGKVTICWDKSIEYKSLSQKVVAEDEKHGQWSVRLGHLLTGSQHPNYSPSSSKGEKEIAQWLTSLNFSLEPRKIIKDNEGKFEVDIFLPKYSLGIEYHGLYWHSEIYKEPKDHFNKRIRAEKQNIKLLQFFENEWLLKPEIVKSIILAKIGQGEKLNARELLFKKVENKLANNFLKNNHLMGEYKPAKYYGLYEGERLVSLMGVQVVRKNELEISRFCNLSGVIVRGGYSKILSNILKLIPKIKKIVSFVDLRYGDGSSLLKQGYQQESVSLGWWWTDGYEVYNRRYCRANMDERKLTERQYAQEMGLYRVYDAGQGKFVKVLNKNEKLEVG